MGVLRFAVALSALVTRVAASEDAPLLGNDVDVAAASVRTLQRPAEAGEPTTTTTTTATTTTTTSKSLNVAVVRGSFSFEAPDIRSYVGSNVEHVITALGETIGQLSSTPPRFVHVTLESSSRRLGNLRSERALSGQSIVAIFDVHLLQDEVASGSIASPDVIAEKLRSTSVDSATAVLDSMLDREGLPSNGVSVRSIAVDDLASSAVKNLEDSFASATLGLLFAIGFFSVLVVATIGALLTFVFMVRRARKARRLTARKSEKSVVSDGEVSMKSEAPRKHFRKVWDIAIAYRRSTDGPFAEEVAKELRSRGHKVLMNVDNGIGPCWADGFSNACAHAHVAVIILSRASADEFTKLGFHARAPLDKFLLDCLLCAELIDRGVIRGFAPIIFGELKKEGNDVKPKDQDGLPSYESFFKEGSFSAPPVVKAVEHELALRIHQLGLQKISKHADVERKFVCAVQDLAVRMEGKIDVEQRKMFKAIESALVSAKTSRSFSGLGRE